MRKSFARTLIAVLTLLVMLVQGTWVLAGTTGGLSGTVSDAQTGRPIAGARVSVASPSQNATATSDQQGRYGFVSLGPDTYTLAISAPGYQTFTQPGITIIADQTQTFNFTPTKQLSEIGRTRSRSTTDLVKPGQTADVYSISGQLSQNVQSLGGGASLFQTYSALASVPGVYVPQGTNFGQNNSAPYIRGGDYSQVGFEFDGIPVNRAFDNYVSNTQGITGQQELQVYTGGVPSSSAGEGLSGYINQVIKSGTYPAKANAEGVIGTPSYYHYLRGEYGAASPNRNFSYYFGTTAWNQAYRPGNQFSGGAGIGDLGVNAFPNADAANSITIAPFLAGGVNDIATRESVGNFHIGIPHRNGDGGRDDIQVLASIGRQIFHTNDSLNDYGGLGNPVLVNYNASPNNNGLDPAIAGGPYPYPSSKIYNGPIFNGFDPSKVGTYYFPSAPFTACNAAFGPASATPDGCTSGYIDSNLRGAEDNNNGIVKVQYQKNIGSSAYVRVYGYTNYSSWFLNDPPALYTPYTAVGNLDYELDTHTRGAALEFADQLNSRNLLTGSASYTFASVTRANNNTAVSAGYRVQLRDGSGQCYDPASGARTNCYDARAAGNPQNLRGGYTPANYTGTLAPVTGAALTNGAAYQVVNSGRAVTFNQVQPKFASFSLSDQVNVGDKLKLDIGARYNSYIYALADTSQQAISGGSNALVFQDYNQEHCFNATPAAGQKQFVIAPAPTFACPAGYAHTALTNSYDGNLKADVFEPRFGGTYTFSPYDVVRFSAGKYSQATNSASVQYNRAGDLASYTASNFLQYGFSSPRHDQTPQLSYNYDLSYEKRLKNSPMSFSFTPFYRQTKQQSQSFFLDPRTNFVSGLNVGTLRAFGFEMLGRYGDFDRDGISGQVSFAYTNSKIKYENFAGQGTNLIDLINNELVGGYNKLTAAGGGSPCYAAGAGAGLVGGACAPGSTPNPYYNQQPQAGLDRNGYFSPYDLVPAAAGGTFAVGSSNSYEVPYTMTAIVQYRKNGLRIVPTIQYDSGFRYGSPFAWQGYDPSQCTTPTDTATCVAAGQTIFRPNPYTGQFDGLGTFKSPGTLSISAQVAKDFSKRVTATAILSNLYRHCFTRGYAWEQGGNQACAYGVNAPYGNGGAYLGNGTTTGATYARIQSDPYGYAPNTYGLPFSAFLSLSVKM